MHASSSIDVRDETKLEEEGLLSEAVSAWLRGWLAGCFIRFVVAGSSSLPRRIVPAASLYCIYRVKVYDRRRNV